MARSVRSSELETRTNRLKLPRSKEPYWTKIAKGLFVGYYRGKSGTWLARQHVGGTKYAREPLGNADDFNEADGIETLNFFQAQERARAWAAGRVLAERAGADPNYTTEQAFADYLAEKALDETRTPDSMKTFSGSVKQVAADWRGRKVADVTHVHVKEWHRQLARTPKRVRTRMGEPRRYFLASANDPEQIRRRKSTANRLLSYFKAAMNHAWREGKVASDDGWRRVKPFAGVEEAKPHFFDEEQLPRFLAAARAWPADKKFYELIRGGLLCGARWGGLADMRVGAYSSATRKVSVIEKGRRQRFIPLSDEGVEFFEGLTAGRDPNDWMFKKSSGGQWKRNHQAKPMLWASQRAKIVPAATFHTTRHTYAARLINNGASLEIVAELLGHSDTRITKKHYAHLMQDYVAEQLRKYMPVVGGASPGNVRTMRRKTAKAA